MGQINGQKEKKKTVHTDSICTNNNPQDVLCNVAEK